MRSTDAQRKLLAGYPDTTVVGVVVGGGCYARKFDVAIPSGTCAQCCSCGDGQIAANLNNPAYDDPSCCNKIMMVSVKSDSTVGDLISAVNQILGTDYKSAFNCGFRLMNDDIIGPIAFNHADDHPVTIHIFDPCCGICTIA